MTLTAGRTRGSRRLVELRTASMPIAQTAVAAGFSWWIASDLLGHTTPLFAPISAVIALGLNAGYRTRRAVEMVLGVALGIAVGDALVDAIGTGPVQIGFVVLLAMSAAVVLGGGALLVAQAAISAVLVATLPSSGGLVPTRLLDTLVGGAIGLAVLIIAPGNPLRIAQRSGEPVLADLAAGLERIAAALEGRDAEGARAALAQMRAIDGPARAFNDDLLRVRETVRLAPTHWHSRDPIERLAGAAPHIDHAVRNSRVLARAAKRAIDLEPETPPDIIAAVRMLAEAAGTIFGELLDDRPATRVTELLLDAAGRSTRALDPGATLSTGALAGQVRSIALDLLRAIGLDHEQAARSVRRASLAPVS